MRSELSVSGGDWSKHGYAHSDILRFGSRFSCLRHQCLTAAPCMRAATRLLRSFRELMRASYHERYGTAGLRHAVLLLPLPAACARLPFGLLLIHLCPLCAPTGVCKGL